MKIISWNILVYNKNVRRSIDFAFSQNPDIICLQEFKINYKHLLKKYSDYDFYFARDCTVHTLRIRKNIYADLVIGVRKKYKSKFNRIKFPKKSFPSLLAKIAGWEECLESLYVDFSLNGEQFRIFNSHFTCATGPHKRIEEFENVISQHHDGKINIYSGDFNVMARPIYSPFIGWLFGFSFKDYFLNEPKIFSNIFNKNKLKNIFKGYTTFPFSGLQLDHILVPKRIKVNNLKTIKKSLLYSDHLMIVADLKI